MGMPDKVFLIAVIVWMVSVLIASVGMYLDWSLAIIFTAYLIVVISCTVVVLLAIQKWIER